MTSKNNATSYTLEVPDLDALPFVPLNDARKMPIDPAVYFVRGADRRVVYVGTTDCLAQRYAGHHRMKEFQALEQGEIVWIIVHDKASRLALEAYCIDALQPALNNAPVASRINRWGESCTRVILQVPDDIYEKIVLLAEDDHRSVPQHITYILRCAVEPSPDPLPQPQTPPTKAPGRKRTQSDANQLSLFEPYPTPAH